MATRKNTEIANIWIGYIFAKLYESFPMPYDLLLEEITESTRELPNVDPGEFLFYLGRWLEDEGYIRAGQGALGEEGIDEGVLTEKGLRVLNAMPDSLSPGTKLGDRLVEASKDIGQEAVKNSVGEWIGQVIGGVIKSVSF